jgi:hypothetical protein
MAATDAIVANPDAAWTAYASGDSAALESIVPSLKVLTPASGEEVSVSDVVGSGKGLVVFMRHVG